MNFDPRLDDWLRAAGAGSRDAWALCLQAIGPNVRALVHACLAGVPGVRDVAEDVTQEALLSLAAGFTGFRIEDAAQFWAVARGIARHKVADHFRRENRPSRRKPRLQGSATHPDVSTVSDLWSKLSASSRSPSSSAASRELFRILIEELGALPEHHREAVVLAFFEGLNTTEMGQRFGISRAAAANRVVRAVEALEGRWNRRMGRGRDA